MDSDIVDLVLEKVHRTLLSWPVPTCVHELSGTFTVWSTDEDRVTDLDQYTDGNWSSSVGGVDTFTLSGPAHSCSWRFQWQHENEDVNETARSPQFLVKKEIDPTVKSKDNLFSLVVSMTLSRLLVSDKSVHTYVLTPQHHHLGT